MKYWTLLLIVFATFSAQAQTSTDTYLRHTNGETERFVVRDNGQTLYMKYSVKGSLVETGFYNGSERDGVWQRFDENGVKLEEIQYQDGCKDGTQIVYTLSGDLLYQVEYNNGVINKAIEFANDGSVVAVR